MQRTILKWSLWLPLYTWRLRPSSLEPEAPLSVNHGLAIL
jgi:hypothetical protein